MPCGLYRFSSSSNMEDTVMLTRIDESSLSLGFPEPLYSAEYGRLLLRRMLLRSDDYDLHHDHNNNNNVQTTMINPHPQQQLKISRRRHTTTTDGESSFCLSMVDDSATALPSSEVLLACSSSSSQSSSNNLINSIVGSYYDVDHSDTVAYRISEASLHASFQSNQQESSSSFYRTTQNRPWLQQMVIQQPATLFWILLNMGLAFYYWSRLLSRIRFTHGLALWLRFWWGITSCRNFLR